MSLENQFVVVLAYIEYCGIKLDIAGWIKKSEEDLTNLKSITEQLNKMVIDLKNNLSDNIS